MLEDLPQHDRAKHWDMAVFGKQTECGTVACAAGHCGLDWWFNLEGFKLEFFPCECCTCKNSGAPIFLTNFGNDGDLVKSFFGARGSQLIFFNTLTRPVEAVIEEVRSEIAGLMYARVVAGRIAA